MVWTVSNYIVRFYQLNVTMIHKALNGIHVFKQKQLNMLAVAINSA